MSVLDSRMRASLGPGPHADAVHSLIWAASNPSYEETAVDGFGENVEEIFDDVVDGIADAVTDIDATEVWDDVTDGVGEAWDVVSEEAGELLE
ncbi:hypothetical protein K3N28_11455 [Glycomyces sp. TRM65418]|uniref:hypothetical protein n=1 Tax=Glycomyces sp. TRM65418 TaxID=2867006 RepID=UPI001D165724|nr:hypothetical protein [Glycomyces sp. TRM65418]MCC3763686.1 hypothetical protein [Glycomyces sp. TRM65418]